MTITNIQQIKDSVDLLDLFLEGNSPSSIITHSRKVLCCFHSEKTPSLQLKKDYYYCFGCGEQGDVISFVQKTKSMDFYNAVSFIAQKGGVSIKGDKKKGKDLPYQESFKLMNQIAIFYFCELFQYPGIENHLKLRGLKKGTIRKHQIGYSCGNTLHRYLLRGGFSIKLATDLGLLQANLQDTLAKRIIFPIKDKAGRVIAFGGRVVSKKYAPKYLNTKNNIFFQKGKVLFNRDNLSTDPDVYITEGYTDAILLGQAGYNAVAVLGTSFSQEQMDSIFNYNPIFCFDGDEAGQKRMEKIIQSFLPRVRNVDDFYVLILPKGKDPADLAITGEFAAIKNSKRNLVGYILNVSDHFKRRALIERISDKNLRVYISNCLSKEDNNDTQTKQEVG